MKWKINKWIYMKKFAFLGLMFFILFSQVFADENDFIQIKSNRVLLEIPKNWNHIEKYDKDTGAERIRIISNVIARD